MTHITRFLILIAALLIAALVCSTAFAGRLPSAQEKQALRGPSGYRPGRSDPYATVAYVAAHAGGSAFTGDLASHDLTDTGRAFVGVAKSLQVTGNVSATTVDASASVLANTIAPHSGSAVGVTVGGVQAFTVATAGVTVSAKDLIIEAGPGYSNTYSGIAVTGDSTSDAQVGCYILPLDGNLNGTPTIIMSSNGATAPTFFPGNPSIFTTNSPSFDIYSDTRIDFHIDAFHGMTTPFSITKESVTLAKPLQSSANITTSGSIVTDTIEPNSGSVVSLHNSSGNWRINAAGNLDNLAAGAADILGGWVGLAIQSTILPAFILSNPSSSGTNRISQQADNGVVHERAMCGTGLGGIIGAFLLERGFNTNGIKYALTQAGAYYQFETGGDVGSGTAMLKIQDRNDLLNARGYGWPSVPGTKIREPLTATSTNTSTAIELTSVDGNKPTITADGAHRYRAETVMYATAGANAGKSAAFTFEFLAKRVSGSVSIVAVTAPTTVADESSGTWHCGAGTPSGDTVPVTFSADASSTVKATTVLTEIAAQ